MTRLGVADLLGPLDRAVNEVRLWHRTTEAAAELIAEQGFDHRLGHGLEDAQVYPEVVVTFSVDGAGLS